MKKKLLWIVVVLLLLATAWRLSWPRFLPVIAVHGDPAPRESFEEMVNRAELIVLADVKSVKQGPDFVSSSDQEPAHVGRVPTQRVNLDVVKVYQGDAAPGQTLTLYQGYVGVTWVGKLQLPFFMIDENDPIYERGERYLLMLIPASIPEELKPYQPKPWQEGMFTVIYPESRMRLNADGTVISVLDSFRTNGKTLEEIEEMIATATVLTSNDIIPPPATLEINGILQTSAIGTYCWSEEKGGVCADMIGIPTPAEPLTISSPTIAHLSLPIDTSPTVLLLTVIPVTEKDEMQVNASSYRWWNFEAEGRRSELPLQSKQDIQIDLEPGLYVWNIQVWWDKKGDVIYGFLVEVQ